MLERLKEIPRPILIGLILVVVGGYILLRRSSGSATVGTGSSGATGSPTSADAIAQELAQQTQNNQQQLQQISNTLGSQNANLASDITNQTNASNNAIVDSLKQLNTAVASLAAVNVSTQTSVGSTPAPQPKQSSLFQVGDVILAPNSIPVGNTNATGNPDYNSPTRKWYDVFQPYINPSQPFNLDAAIRSATQQSFGAAGQSGDQGAAIARTAAQTGQSSAAIPVAA